MQDNRRKITPLYPPLPGGELKGGCESCIVKCGSRTKGFILLELIVVLFFITVIIGLTSVYFANKLPAYKFNATVRNISTTIKQARALARVHNQPQTVTIDLDAKQYALEGHGSKDIPEDVSIKIEDLWYGDIYNGKYHFVSYGTGSIEGGTIVLWNAKKTVSIQIDPIVGAVVIK